MLRLQREFNKSYIKHPFRCLVLTWHRVEYLSSAQVVASGMDITAILVVSSTSPAWAQLLSNYFHGGPLKADDYGQCGPSRFARKLFFDSLSLLSKPNEMYALSYRVNFIGNAMLMNSMT